MPFYPQLPQPRLAPDERVKVNAKRYFQNIIWNYQYFQMLHLLAGFWREYWTIKRVKILLFWEVFLGRIKLKHIRNKLYF